MSPQLLHLDEKDLLPPKTIFENKKIVDLLIKARSSLGELKGYTLSISNLSLFSAPSIKQSLASSETEGIKTTMVSVLQNQLLPKKEQRKPDKEVLLYKDAGIAGFYNLAKHQITTQMICHIQSILLPGDPHGFRTVSNQIVSTPPNAGQVPALMEDLERFMNSKGTHIDPLLKSILIHYQFEAIHPFRDGNDRVARILMVLLLVQEKVLFFPVVYISGYINKNKKQYFHKLLNVAINDEWEDYILFMLKGFYLGAIETKDLLIKTERSFERLKKKLISNHQKIYSDDLINALYNYPIISPVKLAHELAIHYTTASRYLHELSEAGI